MIRRGMFLVALCAAAIAGACADFEAPEVIMPPDVLVANPSFDNDIQPIFTARCATASCHNFATHQAGLVLEPGVAYDRTVNVRANRRSGWKRVVPFRADSSFLIQVLLADTTKHPEISRMPLGRPPLTENQIQTIVNWVTLGAQRN